MFYEIIGFKEQTDVNMILLVIDKVFELSRLKYISFTKPDEEMLQSSGIELISDL